MKLLPWMAFLLALFVLSACVLQDDSAERQAELAAFAPVQTMLEKNCVHCHGDQRLSTMPSIHDSKALDALIREGGWVTPGKPEASRLYQVVSFSDQVPGAMPPTGHAIRRDEKHVLSEWIRKGAKVPRGRSIRFVVRGEIPRSS
jgi:cytochrome c5